MRSLPDVSFVIPVKIDSTEHNRNLDIVIAFLIQHFDSPIIVLEADVERRYFPKTTSKQLQYLFVEDPQPGFNPTKYLNRLHRMVDTPITAIWEADIIVPPGQVIETADQIRQGKAVIGLPYNGSAYYTTAEIVNTYQQTMAINSLETKRSYLRKMNGRLSVGGAVFVDTAKYKQAGGDNEFFPEGETKELERVKRMEIIYHLPTYRQEEGGLYSLWHPRNNLQHHDMQKEMMLKLEYLKICGMSQKELKRYIESWTWKKQFYA